LKTHLFGELDLDLDKPAKEIYKEAFRISECCGYFIDSDKVKIVVSGSDNEICYLFVKDDKVTKIRRAQFSDSRKIIVPWHEVKKGSYQTIYEVDGL